MRFSAITALCAAPLALAGNLHADLVARGAVDLEVRDKDMMMDNGNDSMGSKGDDMGANMGSKGGSSDHSEQIVSVQDIIVVWFNNGGGAATSTVADTATVAAGGSKATHSVTVGGSAGLVYTPDTIEAAVGDMVIFTFLEQNHTVTQSAFTTPCEKLAGGKDSGFMPNKNSSVVPAPQMAMQVTVATPIWFYCRQAGHCGSGMTFSINPTANKTQAMFQQMAISQNGTGTAAAIAEGSSSAAATPPPPATSAANSAATTMVAPATATGATGLTTGSGTMNSAGSCECSCLCGVAAFPEAAVQGIGGFGGMSGSMPMSALTPY